MSARRFFLDQGWGERRGVVTLDGRAERLLIEREGAADSQRLGAQVVARVRTVDRSLGVAFVEMPQGADAVIRFASEAAKLREGQWVSGEIAAEARRGKGARLRLLAYDQAGPPRLLSPGPTLSEQMSALAHGRPIETGEPAREIADLAQEEALETVFQLRGGGEISVETTRALTAVDVDLADRRGQSAKQVARAANLAAVAEAARILRLKGLGGLVLFDLAGKGQDGPALLAAARAAFAPDNPGVALGPVSRFGTLEIVVPRRARPALEHLAGADGRPTPETAAMAMLRELARAAEADRAARLTAFAGSSVAAAAQPHLPLLTARYGARLALAEDTGAAAWRIQSA